MLKFPEYETNQIIKKADDAEVSLVLMKKINYIRENIANIQSSLDDIDSNIKVGSDIKFTKNRVINIL